MATTSDVHTGVILARYSLYTLVYCGDGPNYVTCELTLNLLYEVKLFI